MMNNCPPTPLVTIFHVAACNLYLALVNGKVGSIQKCTDVDIDPCTKQVDQLDIGFAPTHVVKREPLPGSQTKLCLDAADALELIEWLHLQMPNASTNAFGKAVFGMFPGSEWLREVFAAVGQIACAPALRRPPNPEQLHFIEKAKASDPALFAMLAEFGAEMTAAANAARRVQ